MLFLRGACSHFTRYPDEGGDLMLSSSIVLILLCRNDSGSDTFAFSTVFNLRFNLK
jgi:hypothetical protein